MHVIFQMSNKQSISLLRLLRFCLGLRGRDDRVRALFLPLRVADPRLEAGVLGRPPAWIPFLTTGVGTASSSGRTPGPRGRRRATACRPRAWRPFLQEPRGGAAAAAAAGRRREGRGRAGAAPAPPASRGASSRASQPGRRSAALGPPAPGLLGAWL